MHARGVTAAVAIVAAFLGPACGFALADGVSSGGVSLRAVAVGAGTDGFVTENVAPGAVVSGSVVVDNSTADTVALNMYAADGVTAVTTGAVYPGMNVGATRAGAWVHLGADYVVLSPGAEQTVPFTVDVPAEAAPGDHVAGIVGQNPSSGGDGNGQLVVSEIVREVLPVDVRVRGAAVKQASLTGVAAGTLPGTPDPAVMVGIRNPGALMCRPQLSVAVVSPDGSQQLQTRQLGLVLPGDTITYPFPWPGDLASATGSLEAVLSGCGAIDTITRPLGPAATNPTNSGVGGQAGSGLAVGQLGAGSGAGRSVNAQPRSSDAATSSQSATSGRNGRRNGSGSGSGRYRLGDTGRSTAGRARALRGRGRGGTAQLIARLARKALATTGFPLLLLLIVSVFLLIQDHIDRRDPKLALAPSYGDPLVSFGDDGEGLSAN